MRNPFIILATVLLVISSFPLFLFAREDWTWHRLTERYEFSNMRDYGAVVYPLTLLAQTIDIQETRTGKTVEAPHFSADGIVKERDVVSLQLYVNAQPVSTPIEIVAGTSNDIDPYYNSVAVYRVHDTKTEKSEIAVVQRISPDSEWQTKRKWRVIWVDEAGKSREVIVPYAERSEHLLETLLINNAGVALMSIGFYSDINHFWPSLFFPILYPGGTLLVSIGLFIAAAAYYFRRKRGV